jgi:crotonobetainyl-CoA:carnitine CoA-transferase CaiB-like acyl-CoA transferase
MIPSGILEGIRVIDLTTTLPGPYCTMVLADHGADVVKIERPGVGDSSREAGVAVGGQGSTFLMLNRNKRSLTLDLKHPGARGIFDRLVGTADVLFEMFRPGTMARLGFDHARMAEINPRLVYCSLSGFGQDGPYRDRPGHDVNYLGYAGVLDLVGVRDGAPVVPGVQFADIAAAINAALAIVLALFDRQRTGLGRAVDLAFMDTALAFLTVEAGMYFASGSVPKRGRSDLSGGWPAYAIYETSDARYLTVGAWEEKFWRNLCAAVDRPDLAPHHRAEGATRAWVAAELAATLRTRTLAEWMAIFERADVCAGPVLDVAEALRAPWVGARGIRFAMHHPTAGLLEQLGSPVAMAPKSLVDSTPPPALGEHTRAILAELGYDRATIEGFAQAGVI